MLNHAMLDFKAINRYRAELSDSNFTAAAKVDGDVVELRLHGDVGAEWQKMDSGSVAAFLAQHKDKDVHVAMNSHGGLVFDGIAIHNALASHPGVVTGTVDALAASAMAIIAMACDHLAIHRSAFFMIHRAWGGVVGNSAAMRAIADELDMIDEAQIAMYADKTGMDEDELTKLLVGKVDGTMFSAAKAYELGFVDEIIGADEEGDSEEMAEDDDATVDLEAEKRRMQRAAVVQALAKIAVDK